VVPTPQGPLPIHPVICSDALLSRRVIEGLALGGGDLLTNHTNDGWFEKSQATDLHAAQIRLRAVEAGIPLLRATLTGKSGCFREDGTWALWGGPMERATYAFTVRWRPVATPLRHPALLSILLAVLLAGLAAALLGAARRRTT
jgi:apolipoprotein N-acyltransferase